MCSNNKLQLQLAWSTACSLTLSGNSQIILKNRIQRFLSLVWLPVTVQTPCLLTLWLPTYAARNRTTVRNRTDGSISSWSFCPSVAVLSQLCGQSVPILFLTYSRNLWDHPSRIQVTTLTPPPSNKSSLPIFLSVGFPSSAISSQESLNQ